MAVDYCCEGFCEFVGFEFSVWFGGFSDNWEVEFSKHWWSWAVVSVFGSEMERGRIWGFFWYFLLNCLGPQIKVG